MDLLINADRLLGRIVTLGKIGRGTDGKLTRLAASDADKAGRDQLLAWISEAGLEVAVDRIGNIFGIWRGSAPADEAPIFFGSHIDTVINAGIYDGCYGVLAALEVIETLKGANFKPRRPLALAAFTNEEGVRYMPDMMGSLVYAGGLALEEALATVGTDGSILGNELQRIGYAGNLEPGAIRPAAFIELHVEQGPVLEKEGISIGAVENLQGISWQRITIEGEANHAGTTPMAMRHDAGYVAAKVITFLHAWATSSTTATVATVGCIAFEPNAINVIPSRASFTVDLRDPNEERLKEAEAALADYLEDLARTDAVKISVERLARFEPVAFDPEIVQLVEQSALKRDLTTRRMTSGAGHDAQMLARICPTAMIFVPSIGGISHNPDEYTPAADLIAGANVLLDVITTLAERES